ncbi:MAG: GNAT family N-acetyltransferase [Actinomycetes bacterium]
MDANRRAAVQVVQQGVVLRPMHADDLSFAVSMHRRFFPDGFFARLGAGFLTEYYRAFLTGPYALAYVADLDGRRAGFLVGVTDAAMHRHHVLRTHGRALLLRALVALLVRPRLAWHFLRTRVRRYTRRLVGSGGQTAAAGAPGTAERVGVLSRVAVAEDARAHGIGSALTERFLEGVAEAGCTRVTLVTSVGETGAGAYWAARGWAACGEHSTPDGQRLATYDRSVRPRWGEHEES